MLTMTEINDIRKAFFEKGMNISDISRDFSIDRKTVRKYINQEDFNEKPPLAEKAEVITKLDPYMEEIDRWLEGDKKVRKKQRHTAKRVHARLQEIYPEFDVSYRTVADYVREKKKEIYQINTRSYLPLVHKTGEAQVDFGKADFYERGILYNGSYLNLSYPSSNAGYIQLFKGENRECLFEGLVRIFEFDGGVANRLWFDNASTMVTTILKNHDMSKDRTDERRIFTDSFLRFKEHHGFIAAFCNPSSGNEKGNVENKVGYHRRNFLVPVPEFDDLEEYNKELLERSVRDHEREHYRREGTIGGLHEEDKTALLPLPTVPFDCSRYETYRIDNCGKFKIDGIYTYSTAPKYARNRVLVRITSDKVIPLDESQRPITEHARLYGKSRQESLNWIPYLTQLSRNPGALKYTGVYSMLPETVQIYLNGLNKRDQGKVLKVLAGLTERDGFAKATKSISEAVSRDVRDLESLITLHSHLNQDRVLERMELKNPHLPQMPDFEFQTSVYDALLERDRT
jgi:transposase